VSSKKITSTVLKKGVRKYKSSGLEEKRRIDEATFLKRLRKAVYAALDIPTHHNVTYSNKNIFDLVGRASLRHSFVEDTSKSINRKAGTKVVPDGDTGYYRLKKVESEEWSKKWRVANKKMLLQATKQKLIPAMPSMAVDVNSIPFYGDKEKRTDLDCFLRLVSM
jgi:hypothetical protein